MAKLFIEDLDVRGKRVFVRVDYNVPMDENGVITDDTRIQASLPTVNYLIHGGARIILASHMGRPKGVNRPELSLAPAAARLGELIGMKVTMASDCIGHDVEKMVSGLEDGNVLMLENLRFHSEEEANDPAFSASLAELAQLYVNDAFGTAHRAHASTEGITGYIRQCAAGYLLKKEIDFIGGVLENPKRPFVAVLGGAKVSSKIGVLENLLDKVDAMLIGGAMAYTFYRARGMETGKSLCENDLVDTAKAIMDKAKSTGTKLLLPVDNLVVTEIRSGADSDIVPAEGIPPDREGVDIGPETIKIFSKELAGAATILWNGPMGIFEIDDFSAGTLAVAKAIAASDAVSVVGGGDSVAAVKKLGLADSMSHISTGGGASLEYMEGKVLPGIAALSEKQ